MFPKIGGLGEEMPLHAEYCDRIMQQLRKVNRYLEYKWEDFQGKCNTSVALI